MAVKIASLDYRSEQTLLDTQTQQINTFLANKTVTKITVVDEYIMAHYTNVIPVKATKVKVFNLSERIRQNGITTTESLVDNFISANVTSLSQDPITLDNGVIILVYQ